MSARTRDLLLTALAPAIWGSTYIVTTELLPQVPGWELVEDGHALSRTFAFPDYYRTMSFVNALAHVANAENHHPDLSVHYDRCVVRWSTHDVGGLSENDFICAAKADALAG